jgi:hypothetical protein
MDFKPWYQLQKELQELFNEANAIDLNMPRPEEISPSVVDKIALQMNGSDASAGLIMLLDHVKSKEFLLGRRADVPLVLGDALSRILTLSNLIRTAGTPGNTEWMKESLGALRRLEIRITAKLAELSPLPAAASAAGAEAAAPPSTPAESAAYWAGVFGNPEKKAAANANAKAKKAQAQQEKYRNFLSYARGSFQHDMAVRKWTSAEEGLQDKYYELKTNKITEGAETVFPYTERWYTFVERIFRGEAVGHEGGRYRTRRHKATKHKAKGHKATKHKATKHKATKHKATKHKAKGRKAKGHKATRHS